MHLDVLDLRAFYYRTRLGRSAQRVLQEALRRLWPDTRDMAIVGFGFAVPMLRPFLGDARRVIGLMPGPQGVIPWPAGGPNVSVLVEETRWPIEAGSVDRLIVAHGLETCDGPDALLAEIWRVLAPGGRVVFIVPNRSGLWARRDVTPVRLRPALQLRPARDAAAPQPLRPRAPGRRPLRAAVAPPLLGADRATFWERLGRRFEPRVVAGALLVEASKQVYARLPPSGSKVVVPGPLDVIEGLAGPKPEPVRGHGRTAARARRA